MNKIALFHDYFSHCSGRMFSLNSRQIVLVSFPFFFHPSEDFLTTSCFEIFPLCHSGCFVRPLNHANHLVVSGTEKNWDSNTCCCVNRLCRKKICLITGSYRLLNSKWRIQPAPRRRWNSSCACALLWLPCRMTAVRWRARDTVYCQPATVASTHTVAE